MHEEINSFFLSPNIADVIHITSLTIKTYRLKERQGPNNGYKRPIYYAFL